MPNGRLRRRPVAFTGTCWRQLVVQGSSDGRGELVLMRKDSGALKSRSRAGASLTCPTHTGASTAVALAVLDQRDKHIEGPRTDGSGLPRDEDAPLGTSHFHVTEAVAGLHCFQ